MIGLEIERAIAAWVRFVGDPDTGEISYRVGTESKLVEVRVGADDRDRPIPCIVCEAIEEAWEQDVPASNFRGTARIHFRHGADPTSNVAAPAAEAFALAMKIDAAIHRPEFLAELTVLSIGVLVFAGWTGGINHMAATENRNWIHTWTLPLYVCHEELPHLQNLTETILWR